MATWIAEYLNRHPELAVLPIARRAQNAVAFRRPDNTYVVEFTNFKTHYRNGNTWEPIDPTLQPVTGGFSGTGTRVLIAVDGTVSINGTSYAQRTNRIGLLDINTRTFTATRTLGAGSRNDNEFVRTAAGVQHKLIVHEDGLREELQVAAAPSGGSADYAVLETIVQGFSAPDGDLDEFDVEGYHFPRPRVFDANGVRLPARRLVRFVGGNLRVYTGVALDDLAGAAFPITIDPDFTGSTGDGHVLGTNANYGIARATATNHDVSGTTMFVGQIPSYTVYRGFLKFDTSSLGAGATILQVNLKMTPTADDSVVDFDLQVVKYDWSARDPIVSGNRDLNYDAALTGTLDAVWQNTSAISVGTQSSSSNLDTTWVSKTGTTYYALRSSRDASNTTPASNERVTLATQDNGTSADRPVLSVSVSAAAGAPPFKNRSRQHMMMARA